MSVSCLVKQQPELASAATHLMMFSCWFRSWRNMTSRKVLWEEQGQVQKGARLVRLLSLLACYASLGLPSNTPSHKRKPHLSHFNLTCASVAFWKASKIFFRATTALVFLSTAFQTTCTAQIATRIRKKTCIICCVEAGHTLRGDRGCKHSMQGESAHLPRKLPCQASSVSHTS